MSFSDLSRTQLEDRAAELADLGVQASQMGMAVTRGNMRFRERLIARIASVTAEHYDASGSIEMQARNHQRLTTRLSTLQAMLSEFDEIMAEVAEQIEVDTGNPFL